MKQLFRLNPYRYYAVGDARYRIHMHDEAFGNPSCWICQGAVETFTTSGWHECFVHKKEYKGILAGDSRSVEEKNTEFLEEVLQMLTMWHDGA